MVMLIDFRCSVAIDRQRHGGPGLGGNDHRHERIVVGDRLAVELGDDVTRLEPGLAGRLSLGDRRQHRAVRVRQAERLRVLLGQRVRSGHRTPITPRMTRPDPQLRQDRANRVDRRGEADPDVGRALVGVDRGVHADDFAANVQERSAGVARD